jgi:hypothetical protein
MAIITHYMTEIRTAHGSLHAVDICPPPMGHLDAVSSGCRGASSDASCRAAHP